ncbi:cyclase [Pantanalinema rosaneae CENA516]|uniref:cyclase n=1 Tax=Pantanalinema rosaneae TaxID=1620701 RepID=UPI003D6E2C31
MIASTSSHSTAAVVYPEGNDRGAAALLNGEILLDTRSHTAWGSAVLAQLYLPIDRAIVWQGLTNYPRWTQYFPDLTESRVVAHPTYTRLYQAASKTFVFLTVQVEIYLRVRETALQRIQFQLDGNSAGSFTDFAADLTLHDYANGTLVRYYVQATPTIPVPSLLIQQAIQFDLPSNLRQMRQVLCQA